MVNPPLPQIGYLVKNVQALIRVRMDDVLRPLGLTVPQFVCLDFLKREPEISASDLARGSFVTRQSMNVMLQAMLERGLVERTARPGGGRALPVVLTASGAELLELAHRDVDAIEGRMLSRLEGEEVSGLRDALSSCVAALEGRSAHGTAQAAAERPTVARA